MLFRHSDQIKRTRNEETDTSLWEFHSWTCVRGSPQFPPPRKQRSRYTAGCVGFRSGEITTRHKMCLIWRRRKIAFQIADGLRFQKLEETQVRQLFLLKDAKSSYVSAVCPMVGKAKGSSGVQQVHTGILAKDYWYYKQVFFDPIFGMLEFLKVVNSQL